MGTATVRLRLAGADPGYVPGVVLQVSRTDSSYLNPNFSRDVYLLNVALVTVNDPPVWPSGVYSQFTFQNPGGNLAADDYVKCELWSQQSLFLFEDNILELALSPEGGTFTGPVGVEIIGPYCGDGGIPALACTSAPLPPPNPYIISGGGNGVHGLDNGWIAHRVIVRDNILRKVSDKADQDTLTASWGIRVNSCESLFVDGNIIGQINSPDLTVYWRPHELDYSNVRYVRSFNNQYPDGKLRQLFNDPGFYGNLDFWLDEIETEIEYMFLNLGRKRRKARTVWR
jgi:hypothetical protein